MDCFQARTLSIRENEIRLHEGGGDGGEAFCSEGGPFAYLIDLIRLVTVVNQIPSYLLAC